MFSDASAAATYWYSIMPLFRPASSIRNAGRPDVRGSVERIARDTVRLKDVRAQLRLHRTMKHWLVVHLAAAGALAVLVAAHVVGMLLLM